MNRIITRTASVATALAVAVTTAACTATETETGTSPSTSNAAASTPRLTASDAICGSRLELSVNGRTYAVFLDGENDTRLVDVTDLERNTGCTFAQLPGQARREDSTGSASARIRSGWDAGSNRCVRYTIIDGRQWVLDDPRANGVFLAHGDGIDPADPRCDGGPLPMQPVGNAVRSGGGVGRDPHRVPPRRMGAAGAPRRAAARTALIEPEQPHFLTGGGAVPCPGTVT